MTRSMICILCLTVSFPAASRVDAQFFSKPEANGVSANGSASVPLKPEKLRLVMALYGKGKDIQSAIVALNERKETVKDELVSMKANSESIVFSNSRVGPEDSQDNAQRAMMQMQRRNQRGGRDKPEVPKTTYIASCAMKAEWALPEAGSDALASLPATLMDQIKTRELDGKNVKLDEEEAESQEEMDIMSQAYYSSGAQDPSAPRIEFLAIATPEQASKATTEAFQQAEQEAARIGAAGGLKLGPLVAVSKVSQADAQMYSAFAFQDVFERQNRIPSQFIRDEPLTVKAAVIDELVYNVGVVLVYGIDRSAASP